MRARTAGVAVLVLLAAGCGAHEHHADVVPAGLVAYDHFDTDKATHAAYIADVKTGRVRRLGSIANGGASWSPNGRFLAASVPLGEGEGCSGCEGITVLSVDGSAPHLLRSAGSSGNPSWSPDGKLIAFTHNANPIDAPGEIDVIRPDGTGLRRLTAPGRDFGGSVAWSPNSRRLAVDTGLDGLWVLNADGSDLMRLTPAPVFADRTRPDEHAREDGFPRWSPSGNALVFSRESGTADKPHSDIYVFGADGAHEQRISPSALSGDSPAWSPDGTQIAFVGNKPSSDLLCGSSAVYLMSAQGGVPRSVSPSSPGAVDYPTWSPDGGTIAYKSLRRGDACFDENRKYDVSVVSATGGSARSLTQTAPAWDGSYVLWQPVGQ